MQDLQKLKVLAFIEAYVKHILECIKRCILDDNGVLIVTNDQNWEHLRVDLLEAERSLLEFHEYESGTLEDVDYEQVIDIAPALAQYVEWKRDQIMEHIRDCHRLGTDVARFSYQLGLLAGAVLHLIGVLDSDMDPEYQKYLANEVRKAEQRLVRAHN